MDLFLLSRSRGECVKLSMDSKDGKDVVTFSLGSQAGSTARQPQAWTQGSTSPSPCTWPPPTWRMPSPTWTMPRRRKSPSQWKRDEKRKKDFLAQKAASESVKKEVEVRETTEVQVVIENPVDEIVLENISEEVKKEANVNDLFKIEGEYKNPQFKSWTNVDPGKEVKILWESLERINKEMGIEEIGEGSTCFEHCFEFWGTWRVKKDGMTIDFLKNSENWPKGVKITEVKPA